MPIWFYGQPLSVHPAALKHRTVKDIERVLRRNVRVDTDQVHGRQDIVAVAGWDMQGLPTIVLINVSQALVFHANKPCSEFLYMFEM